MCSNILNYCQKLSSIRKDKEQTTHKWILAMIKYRLMLSIRKDKYQSVYRMISVTILEMHHNRILKITEHFF